MRINVYSQELTKELKLVSKKADDTGITYCGVRMYLASPDILHHTEQDDDRSAITFWIPHAESFKPADLSLLLRRMANLVDEAPLPDWNDGAIVALCKICGHAASLHSGKKGNEFAPDCKHFACICSGLKV